MFGKLKKGLQKINPLSDKKDDPKKDKKGNQEMSRSVSASEEYFIKRQKSKKKEQREQSKTQPADEWDGFATREPSQTMGVQKRPQPQTEPQQPITIVKMVEQRPARRVNVNQSIFAVMAAERDQLPDVEEKKGESSSDDNMIVEMEDPADLDELMDSHRGRNRSSDDDDLFGGKVPDVGAFTYDHRRGNRLAQTLAYDDIQDLNDFNIIDSPSSVESPLTIAEKSTLYNGEPIIPEETKANPVSSIVKSDRRISVQVKLNNNLGSAFIGEDSLDLTDEQKTKIDDIQMDSFLKQAPSRRPEDSIRMDLIRQNTFDAEKTEKAQKIENQSSLRKDQDPKAVKPTEDTKLSQPKDDMAKSLEQAAELTESKKWTGGYGRKFRGVITNAEVFKKEALPQENEIFQDLPTRNAAQNAQTNKKPGSKIEEDDFNEIKSYDSEDSLDKMDESISVAPMPEGYQKEDPKQSVIKKPIDSFVMDMMQKNITASVINRENSEANFNVKYDLFKLINKNEHLFIKYAEKKLVENKLCTIELAQKRMKQTKSENVASQRVLDGPKLMAEISGQMEEARLRVDQRATCTLITDEVILLGTSAGVLWAFERDSQKLWGKFFENDKAFKGNSITCMDVHPLRTEYVILGFQGGQLILIDLTEIQKSKKVVKDHHKNASIVSVKFCDYIKEREGTLAQQLMIAEMEKHGVPVEKIQMTIQSQEVEDKQCWMVMSTDTLGRVVVTSISNLAFGLCTADKMTVIDPNKNEPNYDKIAPLGDGSPLWYPVLESRFYNKLYPQGYQNDSRTLCAIGSSRDVIIYDIQKEKWQRKFRLERPKCYLSENMQGIVTFANEAPCICWGYGRTPCFKDRTYSLLAIAWGALVQIVILNDLQNEGYEFFLDGHYFLAPGTVYNSPENGVVSDIQISAMRFLSESLLFIYTSTQDIRVIYTQKFHEQQFQEPKLTVEAEILRGSLIHSAVVQTQGIDFDKVDSRLKITRIGSILSKEQCDIELERKNFMERPAITSFFNPKAYSTMHSYLDRIVILTDKGLYHLQHLTWQAYLSYLEQKQQASWFDIFEKAIEFFNGRVKGFKGVVDDNDTRKDMIKSDLKELIHGYIERVIKKWKDEAISKKKAGIPPEQVRDDLKGKLCTLIRMSIELCVEIWDPFFLFNELFQKFVEQEMSIQFADEIKPYILSGVFSEMPIPEAILNFHILQHHHNIFLENLTEQTQNTSPTSGKTITTQNPAENFEKIIVNLSFNACGKPYKEELIKFCREHQLSSGLIYLCIQTYDEQGPSVAVAQLCFFYEEASKKEKLKIKKNNESSPYDVPYTIKEIQELDNMPANLPKREFIERSSTYLGYKLMWATRLFLLGKKFPKGNFEMIQWNAVTHDVIELITQAQSIRTFTAIDAEAYFQIISIVFNNPSKQYSFIKEGRTLADNSRGLVKTDKESMSHSMILERLQNFAMNLEPHHEVRMQFLFFVASVSKDVDLDQDKDFFYNVTLELLLHAKNFLSYNKLMLNRQMSNKALYRKMSRDGNNAPDNMKHFALSEANIEQLLRKSEPLQKEQIDTLVEAMQKTNFDSLKLILYAKQENYIKCVQLLLEKQKESSSFLNMKMQDGFAFIIDTFFMLQSRIKTPKEDTPQRYQFEMFENEINNRTHQLVRMDAHKCVGLADALYEGDHNNFVSRLNDYPQEQYLYISKLIELKFAEIKASVQNYTLNNATPSTSKSWLKILRTHLKLACQLAPGEVVQIVEKTIKENFYPLEECLKTCQEFRQLEASAMLTKKIGAYKDSIVLYLQLLEKDLNVKELRKELYLFEKKKKEQEEAAKKQVEAQRKQLLEERKILEMQRQRDIMNNMDVGAFTKMSQQPQQEWPDIDKVFPMPPIEAEMSMAERFKKSIEFKIYCQQEAPNVLLFERIISKIEKICMDHPEELFRTSENTWQTIVTSLFKLNQHPIVHRKRYCRSYLSRKMVLFVKKTLPFINFTEMIKSVCMMQDKIKWRSVRELVSEVFTDIKAEEGMCECANGLVQEECKDMEERMFHVRGTGLVFKYLKCELCKRNVDKTSQESQFTTYVSGYKAEDDTLILFECERSPFYNHVYHNGCLKAFFEEELKKDKKAGLKEVDILKAFRCPFCYQQKQDIGEQTQKMTMMRPSKKEIRSTVVGGKKKEEVKSSGTSSQGDNSDVSPFPKRNLMNQEQDEDAPLRSMKSMKDWRIDRIRDKMKRFDEENDFDSLSIDSFKKM